jgi:outer membrane protein
MNRAATLALVLLALPLAAPAKDLIGVFEDAVHNDPVIRQAEANRMAARESKPQALAALLPQLNGSAGITRDHTSGFQSFIFEVATPPTPANPNPPPQLVVARTADQIDNTIQQWSLNLRQNVFSWSNWMALRAASDEVAQAEANYAAAEQQLILRVAQAYFSVLTAIDTLDADQTALEAISRQLDQANKRFEVGLIAITDVEDAKAARDSAASTVIAAKRTLATSEDQLQEITGEKYDALAKPGANMPLNNPEPADQSRWVNISLEQNLSLISSRLAADIARENVRVAFGGHLPTLDLVAGRSWNYTSSDQVFDGQPFSNVDSKANDRQIGLQFTLPIYSGGFTQSKVRQAQYQWIAAKEGVVQSSRATERQARDAYLGVITGIARVQALRQAVESNQTSLKATEAGYEVGTRTSVDVLNARRLLVQAETDYASARYDYIISVLQLRLAAGNLDRPQLAELNNWLTVKAPTSPAVATPESVSPSVPPSQPLPPSAPPPAPRPQGKR